MADGGISREEWRYDLERRGMKVKTCVNKRDPSGTQEATSSLKKIVVDLQYLGQQSRTMGSGKEVKKCLQTGLEWVEKSLRLDV